MLHRIIIFALFLASGVQADSGIATIMSDDGMFIPRVLFIIFVIFIAIGFYELFSRWRKLPKSKNDDHPAG